MKKEEILQKSREENKRADERSRYVEMQGANFAMGILGIMWVAMYLFAPLDEIAQAAIGLMVTVTCLANWGFQLLKNKTRSSVLFTFVFLIGSVFFFVRFCNEIGVLSLFNH